jgi:formylglycine-generating enzyme required for sulfatase activity
MKKVVKHTRNFQSKMIVAIALFLIIINVQAYANNIGITNPSLTGKNIFTHCIQVQFDIRWENSFRISNGPSNWDAAWIFVKYRVAGGTWQHATIGTTGFMAPAGSSISPATDGKGAFICRDVNGLGTFNKTGVQLCWNYGANGVADNAIVEAKVFAIEMVYIPQGAFSVGSGGTEVGSFTNGSWSSGPTIPLSILSENALLIGLGAGKLWGTSTSGYSTIGIAGTLPAPYPKGYNAFYCMKYELSQQGYVDFLNLLTYSQQNTRTPIPPNSAAGTLINGSANFRNEIKILTPGTNNTIPGVYTTSKPYVACSMSWGDLVAYMDWSGLRPMSELEFEKACRGNLSPTINEFAWGSTVLTKNQGIVSSGMYNEVSAASVNCTYGNQTSVQGPVRVGAMATAATNRISAGATYYGLMEMSGNLWERIVSAGSGTGRLFTALHGNGSLTNAGEADVSNWPPKTASGSGFRGGDWYNDSTSLQISDRGYACVAVGARQSNYGGRGVRTAP